MTTRLSWTSRAFFLALLLASLAVGLLEATAQDRPLLRIETSGVEEEALGRVFDTLDPARIPTGLLHDRVVSLVDVMRFDGTPQAAEATLGTWRQAYHELSRSGVGAATSLHPRGGRTVPGLPPIEAVNEAAAGYLAAGVVPLAVMSIRYDRIKPNALEQGLLRVEGTDLYDVEDAAASPYETHLAFAAVAYEDERHSRSVRFVVAPELYLTHETPRFEHLSVDFGDGRGARRVRVGEAVSVVYATGGVKRITVIAGEAKPALRATTTLAVTGEAIPDPDLSWLNVSADRAFAGGVASYDAHFFLGAGHTWPTRPVVFVEGFDPYFNDPARRRTWQDIYEILLQQDFVLRLQARGYDAVILKLHHAADYVQRNAFALEHLLGRLRAEMPPGEQTVVVGPSMGGLIGRYALAFMEANGIAHNVRLYASLDAPHRGANIPLGDQFFFEFFDSDSQLAQQATDAVNSPAARQLLVYNYQAFPDEDPLRTAFMDEIEALGYPNLRTVSVASGSGHARAQRGNERVGFREMVPGDKIVEYRYRSFLIDLDGDVWAVPDGDPWTQIFEGLKDVIGPHHRSQDVYVRGTLPYDNAPGGFRATQADIAGGDTPYGTIYTSFPEHSWIPTPSALDLNTTDLFYDVATDPAGLVTDYVHGKQSTAQYDAVFYPVDNEDHVEGTEENAAFLLGEIDTVYPASHTVAGDRTFNSGQHVALADGVVLVFDGEVKIDPGVRFSLGRNAKVIFNGRVQANGSPQAPIAFEPAGTGTWKWVELKADGNLFEYVHFDGGLKTVEVRSKDNVFRHCRFENGWRGLSSYYAVSGGRSGFTLEHSVVRNNTSVGVVAYHADPSFLYTTIEGNGQSGAWLYDADVDVFYRSVVENNATISTARSGVEVVGGSYLLLFGPGFGRGLTRVANNTYHEVYVSFSAAGALLGIYGWGGYNSVFDGDEGGNSSSELLLRNASGARVYAHNTYWGVPAPGDGDLSGLVSVGPVLSADPTAAPRPGGLVPAGQYEAEGPPGDGARLAQRMEEIRARLRHDPRAAEGLLRELFLLQRLDPEDALGQRAANEAVLSAWQDRLRHVDRRRGMDDAARQAVRRAGETAVLLAIRGAMLEERYEAARRLLKRHGDLVESPDHRQVLLLERLGLLEQEGRFGEALTLFEGFRADAAARPGESPDLYGIVWETLQEKLEEQAGGSSSFSLAATGAGAEKQAATMLSASAESAGMEPAFPNPFNPTAMIPFRLQEPAQVRIDVFDVMGRRVDVLADARFDAGGHRVTFEAGALASGLYLVRFQAVSQSGAVHVVTQTLSLVQ